MAAVAEVHSAAWAPLEGCSSAAAVDHYSEAAAWAVLEDSSLTAVAEVHSEDFAAAWTLLDGCSSAAAVDQHFEVPAGTSVKGPAPALLDDSAVADFAVEDFVQVESFQLVPRECYLSAAVPKHKWQPKAQP